MKWCFIMLLFAIIFSASANEITDKRTPVCFSIHSSDTIPSWMTGNFIDDYRIRYTVTDSVWIQLPDTKFHILKWNMDQQYLVARNGDHNPGEPGLYTRIDFMQFKGMAPFEWGFCLTAYQAADSLAAESTAAADRSNPKKGCGGFPFSRMKKR